MIKLQIEGNGWKWELKNIENAMHLYKMLQALSTTEFACVIEELENGGVEEWQKKSFTKNLIKKYRGYKWKILYYIIFQ